MRFIFNGSAVVLMSVFMGCSTTPLARKIASDPVPPISIRKEFRIVADVLRMDEALSPDMQNPWVTVYQHDVALPVSVVLPANSSELVCVSNAVDAPIPLEDGRVLYRTVNSGEEIKCRIPEASSLLHSRIEVEYLLEHYQASFEEILEDLQPVYAQIKDLLDQPGMSTEAVALLNSLPNQPLLKYSKSYQVGLNGIEIPRSNAGDVTIYVGSEGEWIVRPNFFSRLFARKTPVVFGPEGMAQKYDRGRQSRLPYPGAQPFSLACGIHRHADGEYLGLAYQGSMAGLPTHISNETGIDHKCLPNVPRQSRGGRQSQFVLNTLEFNKAQVVEEVNSVLAQMESRRVDFQSQLDREKETALLRFTNRLSGFSIDRFNSVQQNLLGLAEKRLEQQRLLERAQSEATRMALMSEKEQERRRLEREIYFLRVSQLFPERIDFSASLLSMDVRFQPFELDGKLAYAVTNSVQRYNSNLEGQEFHLEAPIEGLAQNAIFRTNERYSANSGAIEVRYCPRYFVESRAAQESIVEASNRSFRSRESLESALRDKGARTTYNCTSVVQNGLVAQLIRQEQYQFCLSAVEPTSGDQVSYRPNSVRALYRTESNWFEYYLERTSGNHPFFQVANQTMNVSDLGSSESRTRVCGSSDNAFAGLEEITQSLQ